MIAISLVLFTLTAVFSCQAMEDDYDDVVNYCVQDDDDNVPLPQPQQSIFLQKVKPQIKTNDSIVCIGLDPDWEKMPSFFTKNMTEAVALESKSPPDHPYIKEAAMFAFLKIVVACTAKYACCYKLQEACYKPYGDLLANTTHFIKEKYPEMPIIIDGKACDIPNTMKFHADYVFKKLGAHGMTVVPYMGNTIKQLDPLKTAIIVVQSSNPEGEEIQNRLVFSENLNCYTQEWKDTLSRVVKWNTNKNLMAVVSGNLPKQDYKWIRETVGPDLFFLIPGVGAQGAEPKNFVPYLKNENNSGLVVNASRSILYSDDVSDPIWEDNIEQKAKKLKDELNEARFYQPADLNPENEILKIITQMQSAHL